MFEQIVISIFESRTALVSPKDCSFRVAYLKRKTVVGVVMDPFSPFSSGKSDYLP